MYRDLQPPPVVNGCPRRERFHRVLSTAQVLITRADDGAPTPDRRHDVERRSRVPAAVGRDSVVAHDEATTASWDAIREIRARLSVAAFGAPAWILDRAERSRLLAIDAARGLIELDSGPSGSLRDLRAEANTVHWTHTGQPRTAELQ